MPYQYWEPIVLEEHMFYASEIAQLYQIYSINTTMTNPHGGLVTAILQEYVDSCVPSYQQRYYYTAHGMVKVYPHEIYHVAITNFLSQFDWQAETYSVKFNLKRYNFRIPYQSN